MSKNKSQTQPPVPQAPPVEDGHGEYVISVRSPESPFAVRMSHALAFAALQSDDPQVIAGLGWLQTVTAAAPWISRAIGKGADELMGSVVMPDGPPVVFNGVNLTAVLRRILDVKEEPRKVAPKVPARKTVAKKPAKKVKP